MKGILFGGCSFTWGQGLYFYSDLNRMVEPPEWQFKPELVHHPHKRFKDTIRFPRLVANHFGTFECVKIPNGGSEDETFDFFKKIFDKDMLYPNLKFLTEEILNYDDIEFIVLQTSQIYRNRFYFTLDGVSHWSNVWNPNFGHNYDNFMKWLNQNDLTFETWFELFSDIQVKRLKSELEFYESKGIKTIVFCWEEHHLPYMKRDAFFDNRYFKLEYNNKEYETIREMMNQNRELEISKDFKNLGIDPPKDHHPSKLCHQVLANNIIKKIESLL